LTELVDQMGDKAWKEISTEMKKKFDNFEKSAK
jgi:hypothetical protein